MEGLDEPSNRCGQKCTYSWENKNLVKMQLADLHVPIPLPIYLFIDWIYT